LFGKRLGPKDLLSQNSIGSLALIPPDLMSFKRHASPKLEIRHLEKLINDTASQDQGGKANYGYLRKFTTPVNSFRPGRREERAIPDMDLCGSNGRFGHNDLDKLSKQDSKVFSEKIINPLEETKAITTLLNIQKEEPPMQKSSIIKQSTMDIIGNSVTIR